MEDRLILWEIRRKTISYQTFASRYITNINSAKIYFKIRFHKHVFQQLLYIQWERSRQTILFQTYT